jgi:hypothetical protein
MRSPRATAMGVRRGEAPRSNEDVRVGAPKARPAGAARGDGVPASDGDGGSGGAKPPGPTKMFG